MSLTKEDLSKFFKNASARNKEKPEVETPDSVINKQENKENKEPEVETITEEEYKKRVNEAANQSVFDTFDKVYEEIRVLIPQNIGKPDTQKKYREILSNIVSSRKVLRTQLDYTDELKKKHLKQEEDELKAQKEKQKEEAENEKT